MVDLLLHEDEDGIRLSLQLALEVDDDGPGCARGGAQPPVRLVQARRGAGVRGSREGTGLGLALVAQHAAAHHGEVVAVDRPGGGTRFVVVLPP